MGSKSNRTKDEFLGMPYATASRRLQRQIMFAMAQRLGEDSCFRCDTKIKRVEDMSIEHKEAWLHADVALFWSLENIAFSHQRCNSRAARKQKPREVPEGMLWCSGCKQLLSIDQFSREKRRPQNNRGFRYDCKKCHAECMGRVRFRQMMT